MLIDWFTVGAQVLNFLVLLVLLKRFLYGPIVKAMDAREREVAGRIQDAEALGDEARQEADRLADDRRRLEDASATLLAQARTEAEETRRRLVETAHAEATRARQTWVEALEREKASFVRALSQLAGTEALRVAARTLQDLSDTDLNARVVEIFLTRLREAIVGEGLSSEDLREDSTIRVASSHPLPDATRGRITACLAQDLGLELPVRFEVDRSMILGLRVTAAGRQIGLTVAEYLEELRGAFDQALDDELEERHARARGLDLTRSGR